jgi:hypothetical protein
MPDVQEVGSIAVESFAKNAQLSEIALEGARRENSAQDELR